MTAVIYDAYFRVYTLAKES